MPAHAGGLDNFLNSPLLRDTVKACALVLAALGATIYYHWSTNSHLEFELRNPDEPEKTIQVINMEKRAAALQAVPAEKTPVSTGQEIPASSAGMPEATES